MQNLFLLLALGLSLLARGAEYKGTLGELEIEFIEDLRFYFYSAQLKAIFCEKQTAKRPKEKLLHCKEDLWATKATEAFELTPSGTGYSGTWYSLDSPKITHRVTLKAKPANPWPATIETRRERWNHWRVEYPFCTKYNITGLCKKLNTQIEKIIASRCGKRSAFTIKKFEQVEGERLEHLCFLSMEWLGKKYFSLYSSAYDEGLDCNDSYDTFEWATGKELRFDDLAAALAPGMKGQKLDEFKTKLDEALEFHHPVSSQGWALKGRAIHAGSGVGRHCIRMKPILWNRLKMVLKLPEDVLAQFIE